VVAQLDGLETNPLAVRDGRVLSRNLAVAGIRQELDLLWWERLDKELAAAREGDGALLLGRANAANGRRVTDGVYDTTIEAGLAVRCLERSGLGAEPKALVAELTSASEIVGSALAREYLPCAYWPVPPASPPRPSAARTKAPILIVAFSFSTHYPYVMAEALRRGLPTGKLLKSENFGHPLDQMGDDCVDSAIEAYLLDGTVPKESKCT
jgi:pimeloyl-ACP methyl ester carboxylesterase